MKNKKQGKINKAELKELLKKWLGEIVIKEKEKGDYIKAFSFIEGKLAEIEGK